MKGLDGIQGPIYVGTGCVFRRQALYGFDAPKKKNSPSRTCNCCTKLFCFQWRFKGKKKKKQDSTTTTKQKKCSQNVDNDDEDDIRKALTTFDETTIGLITEGKHNIIDFVVLIVKLFLLFLFLSIWSILCS